MPVLDVVTAFCYGPDCRQERQWRRALPTSRVYACTSCERTREFSERDPGSASGSGVIYTPGPAAPTSAREALAQPRRQPARPKTITQPKEKKTMPKTETETKRAFQSPMLTAIDGAVQRAIRPLREELDELKKKLEDLESPEDALTMKDLEKQVDELLEAKLPDFVNRSVLQMLATPKTAVVKPSSSAAAAPASDHECGHKNYMTKCPICQKEKKAKAAAE